jgi:hypothetical protein
MDFFLSKVQSGNKSLGDVALEKEERDMLVPTTHHAFRRISEGQTYSLLRASRAGLIDLETLKDPLSSSSSASRLSEYKRPSQLRYVTYISTSRMDGQP